VPVPPVQVTPPNHLVLPATPPMVNPISHPAGAPSGTSTDSSVHMTASPPTPHGTVSGTSTVPTPPLSAPPTPSAPMRERSVPVLPLFRPACPFVRGRDTLLLHTPQLAQLPADLLHNSETTFISLPHLRRTSLPCICLTTLQL
jgi:hypothetical protein